MPKAVVSKHEMPAWQISSAHMVFLRSFPLNFSYFPSRRVRVIYCFFKTPLCNENGEPLNVYLRTFLFRSSNHLTHLASYIFCMVCSCGCVIIRYGPGPESTLRLLIKGICRGCGN